MPIYEYQCATCGGLTEVLQKVSDPAPESCPACGGASTLEKVVSRSSFQLKGGGWYADLYSSTSKGDASKSSGGSSASASGGSSAPASGSSSASSSGSSSSTSTPTTSTATK
ncbi:FmdB family zinc ribbon protein [Vulgatibacter incomptus]|uniref:Type I antifreeze protein n=1 Tax=Vulgatibacter incomptus TaxID=1391653 RepID=A0A0K1PC62_9BACT|nr:zinc ribbon domain-containing protein [Vulgatibacter incomptus]AKU91097.1 Type I antifreeze protein [Vulgatibacter incomptus]